MNDLKAIIRKDVCSLYKDMGCKNIDGLAVDITLRALCEDEKQVMFRVMAAPGIASDDFEIALNHRITANLISGRYKIPTESTLLISVNEANND